MTRTPFLSLILICAGAMGAASETCRLTPDCSGTSECAVSFAVIGMTDAGMWVEVDGFDGLHLERIEAGSGMERLRVGHLTYEIRNENAGFVILGDGVHGAVVQDGADHVRLTLRARARRYVDYPGSQWAWRGACEGLL